MTTANKTASPARTTTSPARTTATVGPVYFWGIFLLCAFALLVIAWFKLQGPAQTYDDKRAALRTAKLQALQTEDRQNLSNYAWANKEKGVARIPIERAMELVAADMKTAAIAPSAVKVETPYPAGLAPLPAPAPAPATPTPEAAK